MLPMSLEVVVVVVAAVVVVVAVVVAVVIVLCGSGRNVMIKEDKSGIKQ